MSTLWTRRHWLTSQTLGMAALLPGVSRFSRQGTLWRRGIAAAATARGVRVARQAERLDPAPWQALAQRAVDAARSAGARYADARLTRIVLHEYSVGGPRGIGGFPEDEEYVGVGVRALVDGYWGFSASTLATPDEVVRLARDAVAQAKDNANGPPWTVELGQYPVAAGTWATPHRVDPFTISIEEKLDHIAYWHQCAEQARVELVNDGSPSWLRFAREERVLATSDGALCTQTLYESGGLLLCGVPDGQGGYVATVAAHGLERAGVGWELFLDAKISQQFFSGQLAQELAQKAAIPGKPSTIGRYTLICDGATMAALVETTLGVATQLDRALGYEANAGGTSFVDDPLSMVGHLHVTSPLVNLTANRSAPRELATVKWDDEGVEPQPFTLIKDGILTDFQTTREQAAWLAPYYQQHGIAVRSHGCAAAESAQLITMQHMPNLSLEPSASVGAAAIRVEDLVADVQDGILVEHGQVIESDFQARTGLLGGSMREIKNGRLGKTLTGGAVLFTSEDLWKAIKAVGGPATQAVIGTTQYGSGLGFGIVESMETHQLHGKGEPSQVTSHSVRAVAATIANQPLIDPSRKA